MTEYINKFEYVSQLRQCPMGYNVVIQASGWFIEFKALGTRN